MNNYNQYLWEKEIENKIPFIIQNMIGLKKNRITSSILIVAVIVAMGIVSIIVYLNGGIKYSWSHLLYLPIIFSACVWGWKGGVLTALAGALVVGPWMPIDTDTKQMQEFYNWFLRLLIFIFIGGLTGKASELIANVIKKLFLYSQKLSESYESFLYALVNIIDARDAYTYRHSKVVADLAVQIGIKMKLSTEELSCLYWAGLLHDIGKIGIPNEVLNKPEALDEKEWAIMKQHTILGENIVFPVKFLTPIISIVRSHHEKWDGSGYPDGIKEDKIPLLSRIISVADVFQSLISKRPYREFCFSFEQAQAYIQQNSEKLFDPSVVKVFMNIGIEDLKKVCREDT